MKEPYKWVKLNNDDLKWWLVDFDNTLCENSGYPDFVPGGPMEDAVETLQFLDSLGYKITVYTARPWADYYNIEQWCKHYLVPVRRIICGKPLGLVAYDDRNFATRIDWKAVRAHYEAVDKEPIIPMDEVK